MKQKYVSTPNLPHTKIKIGILGGYHFCANIYRDHSSSIWRDDGEWNIMVKDIVPGGYRAKRAFSDANLGYQKELNTHLSLYLQAKEQLEKILVLL